MDDRGSRPAPRRHLALLLVPFVWQVGLLPFVNGIAWTWYSIPFPMLWQMAGIVIATIAIGTVYRIDRRREAADGDAGTSQ